jgi:hypothetical protein
MTKGFDARFLSENPRRRRGDAAASRLWRPNVSRAGRNAVHVGTSRPYQAATKNENFGLIRHDGIPRHDWSDCRIAPDMPARRAA